MGVAISVLFTVADDPSKNFVVLFDESMSCLDGGLQL
jgi:hypothetical protein